MSSCSTHAKVVIGLDPGAHTGVAVFQDGALHSLRTITPHGIADYLRSANAQRVVFEDSRLQSFVWNLGASRHTAMKIARNVGEIDAWCKLIVSICADLGIIAHGISPKRKGAKLNAANFKTLTGWGARSNQHERDAAAVAWPYRNAA